jgi:hypothetical protein
MPESKPSNWIYALDIWIFRISLIHCLYVKCIECINVACVYKIEN